MGDDDVKRLILARRARFMAAALVGVAAGVEACGSKTELNEDVLAGPPDPSVDPPNDPGPRPCLVPPLEPKDSGPPADARPRPCLEPPDVDASPFPCLVPPLAKDSGPDVDASPTPCLCVPSTCAYQPLACGPTPDGCGAVVDCPPCDAGPDGDGGT